MTADTALLDALREAVGDRVVADAPLAGRTTLKVGGPAAALVRADAADDLVSVARVTARLGCAWLILGRGSNLLVSDQGFAGVVVELGRSFRGVEVTGDMAVAGGAERMPALAHAVAGQGLGGLAFGVAIPGTVGGAVRMNAGAHGHETSDVLAWADVVRLARDGCVQRLPAAALGMGYRHTALPLDAVVVRAAFDLQRVDDAQVAREMDEMKRWRREHQPLGERSCGSVFRNPPGDSAGRLIDCAGLKGYSVGGAQVSPKHANFITVTGDGTAADVHAVIRHVQREVARIHDVDLVPEVVMVGFEDDDGPPAGDVPSEGASPGEPVPDRSTTPDRSAPRDSSTVSRGHR